LEVITFLFIENKESKSINNLIGNLQINKYIKVKFQYSKKTKLINDH